MKTIKVRDLGRVITGHTPPTSEAKYFGDYMPFVKPTDISVDSKYTYHPEQYYSEEAAEKYKTSMIPKGSTCVVCIGTIGEKMTMAHCDMFTNQSINTIVPSENYDPDYVYYLLKYNLGKVKALNKGTASGREFVSKSIFLDMPVDIEEDIATQKKIGEIFSCYDLVIETIQKQISLLEESARRIYQHIFGKTSITSEHNISIKNEASNVAVINNILDIFSFKYGKILPTSSFLENGVIPVYGASKCIGYYNESNCFEPKVLVGSRGNAGYVHRTFENETFVTNNSFIISPLPKFDYMKLPYIYETFKSMDFVGICTGAAQPQLTLNSIAGLKVVLPPRELIIQYDGITMPIFEQIAILHKQQKIMVEARERLLLSIFARSFSLL